MLAEVERVYSLIYGIRKVREKNLRDKGVQDPRP